MKKQSIKTNIAIFNARLAQEYMEHRTLLSYLAKINYMGETGFEGDFEDFNRHMKSTMRQFNAMIYEMIVAEND